MPTKGKKFIEKKSSTTFYLGHRSQRDPLVADETAPQRILIPLDQLPSNSSNRPPVQALSKEKRQEEQHKYGIYFDDDYDYLQHLKNGKEVSNIGWDICERIRAQPKSDDTKEEPQQVDCKLKLPSSIFASEYEEDIGMLNKAAPAFGPKPHLDPDIIAALDDDFDFSDPENQLEDNFMELANEMSVETEDDANDCKQHSSDDQKYFDSENSDDNFSEQDEVGSLPNFGGSEDEVERQTRFTNYSMSSSVIQRNKQLLLVDDRFEKMFEEYDDMEIGALECEDIEGDLPLESDLLIKYAEEFERSNNQEESINNKICSLAIEDSDEDAKSQISSCSDEHKEKWDCESILSTYSNKKNRPKLIRETSKRIHVSKNGMPVGVLGKGLTAHNLKQFEAQFENDYPKASIAARSEISALSHRNKNETSEEKLLRKKNYKEYRRTRRQEKKANSVAFKEEKRKQVKELINSKVNIPALKL